ncbi:uncharacterized protein TNIN_488491 [Trichonephila inaurata madagascariensis]|uniref:Uncharacterized protein n=1 Tax=Trichonephila inaurata madagascariensis TaxID=2747483 RepID=A0A8X7C5W8_9ARAC|nr:uncharacterized protein TNIN_488491 [Trichonephila inaurata madagascariensis]
MKSSCLRTLALLAGIIGAVLGQQQQQQQQQQQCNIEECLIKLRDPDPAKEGGDLKIFCSRTVEGLACLDRCLDSPIYQATSPIVMGGVKQLLSEICAPGSSLGKRYMQESKCLNHQNTTVMDCATSMIERYPALIQRPDPESIIKVFCCSIDRTEECIVEKVHKDCGRGAAKLVNEMMGRAFYPINQFVCYFNDPSQCPKF